MADFIPKSDGDFDTWAANFSTVVTAQQDILGLQPADVAPLTAAKGNWTTAYANHVAKQSEARGTTDVKCQTRAVYESVIRSLARRFQASAVVSDQQRREMGITVRDETPTILMAPPPSRPVAMVDTSQRLRHEIRFVDEGTPTSRAKPKGVMGCEIWVKLGTAPPVDPNECSFLAVDTASPYVAVYDGTDAGKTAYYMLRWVSTTGETGPWSETVVATVTA